MHIIIFTAYNTLGISLELTRDQKRAPDPWNRIYGCLRATRCTLGTKFRASQELLCLLWSPLVIITKQSQIFNICRCFFYIPATSPSSASSHNHSQDHFPLHKKTPNPCKTIEQLIQTVKQTVPAQAASTLSFFFNNTLVQKVTIQFSYIFSDFRSIQYFIRKWVLCGKILPNGWLLLVSVLRWGSLSYGVLRGKCIHCLFGLGYFKPMTLVLSYWYLST